MSGKIHLQRKFERAEFSPWASHHSGMGHKSPLADPFKKGFSKSLIQNWLQILFQTSAYNTTKPLMNFINL